MLCSCVGNACVSRRIVLAFELLDVVRLGMVTHTQIVEKEVREWKLCQRKMSNIYIECPFCEWTIKDWSYTGSSFRRIVDVEAVEREVYDHIYA